MARKRDEENLLNVMRSHFRETHEAARSDYAAGTTSKFRPRLNGVDANGSGADYHYRTESKFWGMIERARYFDRNNMIVGQAIDRLVANILQDGITPDPATGDLEANKLLKQKWWKWAEDPDLCDVEGEKAFHELETLALRSMLVDGDIFALLLESGSMQWCEAHRVRTPKARQENTVHGVSIDPATGRREGFWITKEEIELAKAQVTLKQTTFYDARDSQGNRQVLHLYLPKRFSQHRGVTVFARCVDPVGMLDDIHFATLVKAQAAACFTIFEEMAAGGEDTPSGAPLNVGTGRTETITRSDGSEKTQVGLAPGTIIRGRPGAKFTGFSPNVPNPTFFEHSMMTLAIIAVNLDLPVHVLLLDPSKTNFSGWRGAIDQARVRFRQIQRSLINKLHRHVWRWKVLQWIAEDPEVAALHEKLGDKIFECEWRPPSWKYIEPLKDASASILRRRNNDTSFRRLCNERGEDSDEIVDEIIAENGAFIEKAHLEAKRLKTKYPGELEEITWRDVAALPAPDGVTFNVGASPAGGSQAQEEE